jgi:succinate dehydrogenase/fumarate reductase cytochrome b subunit (b558 family)
LSAPATAVSPAESSGADRGSRRAASRKKWQSLTGVVPLGIFLLEHLWTNAKALQGAEAFNGAVADLQAIPLLPVLELFGIFLPLAFHSLYGIYLAIRGRQDSLQHTYANDSLYLLQRVSGVLAFAFILYHLATIWLQKLLSGLSPDAFYQTLEAQLSSTHWGVPWAALFYVIGLAATVFHFANGVPPFCIAWRLTVTANAQRRVAIASWVLGGFLFSLGTDTVVFFATGSRFFPASWTRSPHATTMPCPATSGALQAPAPPAPP